MIKSHESSQSFNYTMVVVLIALATIMVFSNMYLTQPVLPLIGREFNLSPAQTGLTVSCLVLAIAFSSIFAGLISDKLGRKPLMVFSLLALSLPTFLCAVAPGFGWLIFFRVGQGLLIPGFTGIAITYLQEEMPPQKRGVAVAYYISATVTGGFFGRLCGGLLTEWLGSWRITFIIFAVGNILLAGLLAKLLPQSRHFTKNSPQPTPKATSLRGGSVIWQHLTNPALLGGYLTGLCLMYAFMGLFTYLPYYLSQAPFNLSVTFISFAYVTYLVGVCSSPFAARFVPRFGTRSVLRVGFGFMFCGALFTLIPTLPTVIFGLLVLCFGMFGAQATATAMVAEIAPTGGGRGSAISLYQTFFYIGGSLGGFVPGLLWQAGGWDFLVAGLFVAIGLGVAAVTWLARPPTTRLETD